MSRRPPEESLPEESAPGGEELVVRKAEEDDWGQISSGEDESASSERPGSRVVIGILAVALIAAALVGWFLLRDDAPEPPPPEPVAEPVAAEEAPPVIEEPPLPGLDESDAFLRSLLAAATSHPDALAWLLGDDLIRRIVVVVENIAEGNSPRVPLRGLGPDAPFAVEETEAGLEVAASSFRRYDSVSDAIAEADIGVLAAAIRRVMPLLDEAYGELGRPDRTFLEALLAALDRLTSVPMPEVPILLREVTLRYEYLDPRLEDLDDASKHLLRFGPDNQRRVQSALSRLADDLR